MCAEKNKIGVRRLLISALIFCISPAKLYPQQYLSPVDMEQLDEKKLPFTLEILTTFSITPENSYTSVDLDGDGSDELLFSCNHRFAASDPYYIEAEDIYNHSVIFRANYYNELSQPTCFDLDGDGKKEIIFCEKSPASSRVHILDSKGNQLCSFIAATAPGKTARPWTCGVNAAHLMDINHDGRLDILFTLYTNFAYQPRGLLAFDFHNKKILWEYRTGFSLRWPQLFDVDGDGPREILLGSASPMNGAGVQINGTDDEHIYIMAIDSLGQCRNKTVVGGGFASVDLYVHNLNGEGKSEILAVCNSTIASGHQALVALWNPLTGNLGPKIAMEKRISQNIEFLDVDLDGDDDIVLPWDDGTLEFRNHRLELLKSRQFTRFSPFSFDNHGYCIDLNNDGEKEIIFPGQYQGRSIICVLDRNMRPIASTKHAATIGSLLFFHSRQALVKELFMLASVDKQAVLHKMQKQPISAVLQEKVPWQWIGCGILCGMLLTGISLGFYYSTKSRKSHIALLKSAFQSIKTCMMVLNADGIIIAFNRGIEHLMGIEMMTDVSYEKIFHDPVLIEMKQMIESSLQNGQAYRDKEITLLNDSTPANLLMSIAFFPLDNKKPGRLVTILDITEIVQSKRTVAWASMAQKLAHEIKTPLSTVMLSAQRLQMEYEARPEEAKKAQKYLDHITNQVYRLRKMTDAFIKFAKIELPKLEPCSINQIVTECLEDSQLKMGNEICVIRTLAGDLSMIPVDRQQIKIALLNLIDNSMNAMQGQGTLTISTRMVQSMQTPGSKKGAGESIEIEISDTGKGIPKEQQGQLFQPFFSRSPGGTGLGLVIVKKIVEDHLGSLKIASEEGIGTTVWIVLPGSGKPL